MRFPSRYLMLLAGCLCILVAWLSRLVGFSLIPYWRIIRALLLAAGLILVAVSLLRLVSQSSRAPHPLLRKIQAASRAGTNAVDHFFCSARIGLTFAWLAILLTAVFSVWYSSLGLFPRFPNLGNLYINQAQAFLHGQVSLLEKPNAQLLALKDPYQLEARKNISFIWDSTLYNGKYYIYWGPIPALIFAGLMALFGSVPGQLLVILAAVGLSVIAFSMLWEIRRRFYPQAPPLSIGLFLIVITINLPVIFILGTGRVYETSILVGQFFLFLGLAGWFFYCRSEKLAWLALAGSGWGLAITTRYNLAVSVVVYLAFSLPSLWKWAAARASALRRIFVLLAPLALCALGMAAFNWLRFDSPFETGLNYQLTGTVYQHHHFSPTFFLSNLYYYLVYPYRKVSLFPVIRSIAVTPQDAPAWTGFPRGHSFSAVVFSMRALPIFWLLVPTLLLLGVCWLVLRRKAERPTQPEGHGWPQFAWMLALGGALQFIFLLFYYYTTIRFLDDFFLPFLLTLLFALWWLDRRIVHLGWLRALMWSGVALVVVWTMAFAFFAGFDNPPRVFNVYNFPVEKTIADAWNAVYTYPGAIGKGLRYVVALFF